MILFFASVQRQMKERYMYDNNSDAQEAKRKFFDPRREEQQKIFDEWLNYAFLTNDEAASKFIAMQRNDLIAAGELDAEAAKIREENFTCQDIWKITEAAIQRYAKNHLNHIVRHGEHNGVKKDAIINVLAQASGVKSSAPITYDEDSAAPAATAEDAKRVQRVIAKFILRNEVRAPSSADSVSYFVDKLHHQTVRVRLSRKNAYTEEERLGMSEWQEKERLMYAASNVPYFQGLALYLLSIAFPFFSLLLLIPGKQSGFLLWFLLWLWIKSWDIGYALVMLLDDLLFAIFSVERQAIGQMHGTDYDQDMAIAFASLGEMDPTFQLGNHYSLVAVATLAVPVTTAQLVLGGVRGGSQLISAGVEQASSFFSDRVEAGVSQRLTNALKNEAQQLKVGAMKRYAANINQGRSPLAGEKIPVNNIVQHTLGGSQSVGTSSAAWHEEANRTAGEKSRLDAQQGQQAGIAAGRSNPFRLSKTGYPSKAMQGLLNGVYASDRNLEKARMDQRMNLGAAYFSKAQALARWFQDQSAQADEIYERIGAAGAIPLPWANFTREASEEEFELILARHDYQRKMEQAKIQADAEMAEGFRQFAEANWDYFSGFGRNNDKERGSASLARQEGARVTLKNIEDLSPAAKQELKNRYSDYLTRKQRVVEGVRNKRLRAGMLTAGTAAGTLAFTEQGQAFWNGMAGKLYPKLENLDGVGMMGTAVNKDEQKAAVRAEHGDTYITQTPRDK